MDTGIELLHRISGIVSSDLSLSRILSDLVGLVVSVTNCDACLVYLIDEATAAIVLSASQLPHTTEIGNIRLKVGEGVTGWVAKHGSVVALSEHAFKDSRFKSFQSLPEDTYEAFLSIPIVSGGKALGVINVHRKQPHHHTVEEISLLSYVAEQMGGAIVKARLLNQSRAAAKKFETLAAVGEAIATQGYLDGILQAISELVAITFDSPLCSIMLIDENRRELTIKAARCSSPDYLNTAPIRIEDSLIGRVVRSRQLLAVEDVKSDELYRYPELARKTGLSSLLSVPLMAGNGVIGTLNIYIREQRAFTDEEISFAKAVAGQAGLALEKDHLIEETLEMKRALEERKLIERAKGILQYRDGLTEEDAYLHLRDESRRMRKQMRDLAEAIILAEEIRRKGGRKEASVPG